MARGEQDNDRKLDAALETLAAAVQDEPVSERLQDLARELAAALGRDRGDDPLPEDGTAAD